MGKSCLDNGVHLTDQNLLSWFGCKILDYVHRLLKKDFGISEAATGIEGKNKRFLRPDDPKVIDILYKKGCDGMSATNYREQFEQFIKTQKKTT